MSDRNIFGIRMVTASQAKREAARREALREANGDSDTSRAAAVRMLYAAIDHLPTDDAVVAIVTAIRDRPEFTADQLDQMANHIGREAHERGRKGT